MNPRQRRGVLLLVLAAIGLVVVFVLVRNYVADVRAEVSPKVLVVGLRAPVRANEPFTDDKLVTYSVAQRYSARTAIRDRSQLAGLVAASDLPAGSILQQGMGVAPPELEPGQREIAIIVDAETGVAGKVQPGDTVDIIGTFGGDNNGRQARSRVVVPGARVLDIGTTRQRSGPGDGGQGASQADAQAVVPVTFALSVRQSLVLTYAESFAQEVRLALVRRGEISRIPSDQREYRQAP